MVTDKCRPDAAVKLLSQLIEDGWLKIADLFISSNTRPGGSVPVTNNLHLHYIIASSYATGY
jgi:hypothetical protein